MELKRVIISIVVVACVTVFVKFLFFLYGMVATIMRVLHSFGGVASVTLVVLGAKLRYFIPMKVEEIATTTPKVDLREEFRDKEDLMLITKAFDTDDFKTFVRNLEEASGCSITLTLPSLESFRLKSQKQLGRTDSSTSSTTATEVPTMPTSVRPHGQEEVNIFLNDNCQLVIKPYGDITREKSEVLVCVVDRTMNLKKTRVGQAFIRACPDLQKTLQSKHPQESVVVTEGSFNLLKCRAICHIVLERWEPRTSPAFLKEAVASVLNHAKRLHAKSVSFPVVGYGRAFRFPASEVADIMLSCMASARLGDSLQNIVVLAPEEELMREYRHAARGIFPERSFDNPLSLEDKPPEDFPSQFCWDSDDYDEEEENDKDEDDDEKNGQEQILYDFQPSGDAYIVIDKSLDVEDISVKLKDYITKFCLHTDSFNAEVIKDWPMESRRRIYREAQQRFVFVEYALHATNGNPGYRIKGTKTDVDHMKAFIGHEFRELCLQIPQGSTLFSSVPERGTVEFLKYAAERGELFPKDWKLATSKRAQRQGLLHEGRKTVLFNVNSRTEAAITKLITNTWERNLVGKGNDAFGLYHSGIKVLGIKRVENVHLFEGYMMQRKRLLKKMSRRGHICQDIGKLLGSKSGVLTTEYLEDFMKEELYWEINEHYLFHGTKEKFMNALVVNGIDPKVSSHKAMFGRGVYAAESVTKSDQYTDMMDDRSDPGTELYLILARMLLGNVFLCDHRHDTVQDRDGEKLSRPPCMGCRKDKCSCGCDHYDSVMGDGTWLFREFVVYEMSQCYPEYVIKYVRV